MCWNSQISLNTFLFSTFILILIIYNNKNTQYKIHDFNNIYAYLFLFSFIAMQLVEYFLWKNLSNKSVNHFFSLMGSLLLLLQPFFSLMMLKNHQLRNWIAPGYLIIGAINLFYQNWKTPFYTSVSKNSHLIWNWGKWNYYSILYIGWLILISLSFFLNKQYYFIIIGIGLLLLSYYFYFRDGSVHSIWCWSVNIIMFILAAKLLMVLPYREKKC